MYPDGINPHVHAPAPAPAPKPKAPEPEAAEHGGEHSDFWGYFENFKQGKGKGDAAATVEGITEYGNTINQAKGLTSGARSANLADHLAQNATAMGNTAAANRFTAYADDARGPLNTLVGEGSSISKGFGVASGVLGGLGVAQGVTEMVHGNGTQGSLDTIAGGLGIAAAVNPALAPLAIGAGLVASGNEETKNWGLWGKNQDGTNKDSLQFVGDDTSSAFNSVDKWAGGGVMGGIAGGIAGGATALGTGVLALGGDVVGGVVSTAKTVGNFIGDVGSGIGNAVGAVFDW